MNFHTYNEILHPFPAINKGFVPSDEECFFLWDKYEMPDNIKEHSYLVGEVATKIAEFGKEKGYNVDVRVVRAGGFLHDLGKFYALKFGGSHSQIGASWVMEETKNPAIAQSVMHHVYWPGEVDLKCFFVPLVVLYADKRVKHSHIVSLEERYKDILERYGTTEKRREMIMASFKKAKDIEIEICKRLKVDLNENNFDRWRMVS